MATDLERLLEHVPRDGWALAKNIADAAGITRRTAGPKLRALELQGFVEFRQVKPELREWRRVR